MDFVIAMEKTKMLKLLDVLKISEAELKNYKVHFAIGATDKMVPYHKFLIGEFKEWQEGQTNKNFHRPYVLSLIYYKKDLWIFGGVYQVTGKPVPIENPEDNWKGWKYTTELMECQTDLIGRIMVSYKKEYRQSYPNLEMIPENGMRPRDMCVSSILDKRVSINDFVGFDKVNIDYETLQVIMRDNIPSWRAALSNVKGIYLIADMKTGKQYVGSAYGDECIWQRWSAYAKDGHGGNQELKALLSEQGEKYKYNFKYSILEVCNMNLGNDYIIGRESYWKEVLQTREFGLNKN